MIIATWNVNSLPARLAHVTRWLQSAQPDVLCLQEIKCTDERFPREAFAEIGYHVAAHGQRTYNGVAILARTEPKDVQRGFGLNSNNLNQANSNESNLNHASFDESGLNESNLTAVDNAVDDFDDSQARLIAAKIAGVRVIDVYCPNGQSVGSAKYEYKLNWFARLQEFIEASCGREEQIALCGDFNIAPDDRDVHNPAAWAGKVLVSAAERAAFEALKEWGFSDAFRVLHDEAGVYSWWDYRGGDFRRNAGLRIDHILISDQVRERLKRVWIDAEPRAWERPSDHTPVLAEFE